jgi:hypothetical protein
MRCSGRPPAVWPSALGERHTASRTSATSLDDCWSSPEPSGLDRFFQDFAAESAAGAAAPEMLAAIALAHGVEFVGPPVAVTDPI